LDLDAVHSPGPNLLAAACHTVPLPPASDQIGFSVEGVGATPAVVLLESPKAPRTVSLDGQNLNTFEYSDKEKLLWIHFENDVAPRKLVVQY
jgi:hypothetical protein